MRVSLTAPTARLLKRCYERHFPHAVNTVACYDEAEVVRRVRRLERVRVVILGQFARATLPDEFHLFQAAALIGRALEHYLCCLLMLKTSEGLAAWGQMVDAEERLETALYHLVPDGAERLVDHLTKLLSDTAAVCFPQPVYSSVSFEIIEERCSICGGAPLQCEHEPFQFYGGQLCERLVERLAVRGVDTVAKPRNRRAVNIVYDNGKLSYNHFKGLRAPSSAAADPSGLGTARGIVASASLSNNPRTWTSLLTELKLQDGSFA